MSEPLTFPSIDSQEPTIKPAITYNKWWVDDLRVQTVYRNTPQQTSSLTCVFTKGRKVEGVVVGQDAEGNDIVQAVWNLSDEQAILNIEDVFQFAAVSAAAGNMQVANTLGTLLTLLTQLGYQAGVLK